MRVGTFEGWVSDFQRHAWEFLLACIKPFLVQVSWLLRVFFFFFYSTALGPTVILRALTCLDKGPETGGFSPVLGVVGFISIFYVLGWQWSTDEWANCCCCNFLFAYVRETSAVVSYTFSSVWHTHTHTHTHTRTRTHAHTHTCVRFFSTSLSLPFCDLPFSRGSFSFSFYFLFFRHDGLILDYSCFIHVWSRTNIAHKFYLIFPGTISCFPWHYNESHF